jgi:hypothetical protein
MLPCIIALLELAQIGFDFGIEQAQHQTDAIDYSLRRRFEQSCSLKAK